MRRLYSLPFRLVSEDQQFQKWQWIEVRIEKSPADHRPESHKVYVDTIRVSDTLATAKDWALRRPWWERVPAFSDFQPWTMPASRAASAWRCCARSVCSGWKLHRWTIRVSLQDVERVTLA
jgi:hypothetical protein